MWMGVVQSVAQMRPKQGPNKAPMKHAGLLSHGGPQDVQSKRCIIAYKGNWSLRPPKVLPEVSPPRENAPM